MPGPLAYALHPFLVHAGIDRWLLPRDRAVLVEALDGAWFNLDPHDEIAREILHFGAYEKRNIEIMRALTKGLEGAFLDIGANLGNHTVLLAPGFDTVAAFEPNPSTLQRLRVNLALNGLEGCHVFGHGLSDLNATLPFHAETGSNPGASRFLDESSSGALDLQVRIGDDVVEESGFGPISALKIDVEGHEERVIAGLARTIAAHGPFVFLEWDASRNGPGCPDRLEGYTFHAQKWELSASRWWRPFARGIDTARRPCLVPVERDDLRDRYISMIVAAPPGREL